MHFDKMELKDKDISISDEEEDLEQLRLAALQSLRKPTMANNTAILSKKPPQSLCNRGRGFQGRNTRNGQFNNRSRNTNLISIPTIQTDNLTADTTIPLKRLKYSDNDTVSKLILPQDRYCNLKPSEEKPAEPVSKFDRYDNSDKSESETENELESNSETECDAPKLERADSLEALMQELENEIQGDSKPKEDKVKKRVKKRKRKVCPDSTQNEDASVTETPADVPVATENIVEEKDKLAESKLDESKLKVDDSEDQIASSCSLVQRSVKSRSTVQRKSPLYDRYKRQYYDPPPKVGYPQQNLYPLVFPQNIPFNNPPVIFHPVLSYSSQFPVGNNQVLPGDVPHNFVPSFSERSLSPLTLNTDDALTIARAPLSPRSAAFVLQNREIIERRKKSPRRSYSRSPSPRYRRSKSPRSYNRSPTLALQKFLKSRSPTPNPVQRFSPIYEKAASPTAEKKSSPVRERRLSPKYASPPRERKHSPYRQKRSSPVRDKKLSPGRDAKLLLVRERKISPIRDRKSPVRERRPSPLRDKRTSPVDEHRSPNRRVADRKSPVSNKPAELSPKQNYRVLPKASVRDRLGSRSHFNDIKSSSRVQQNERKVKKSGESVNGSPSPEPPPKEATTPKQNYLDPILEARRRKFESNEIKTTEGIIRLKPKTEPAPKEDVEMEQAENILNDEDFLEIDAEILSTKVDDLFSDEEETDEENEGRFKSHANKRSVSVLPFTQLLGNSAQNVKNESLSQDRPENRKRDRRKTSAKDRRDKSGGRSTAKPKEPKTSKSTSRSDDAKNEPSQKKDAKEKPGVKNRPTYRNEIKRDKVLPIESKKIEIKIRNPAKYETTSKYDVANEHEIEKASRKIETTGKAERDESDSHENEPEIIIDNEDDADLTSKSEGDLRAQLSRKRAERQNKLPVAEDVQSRLLQSALQGAVFKKPKKSKKNKESVSKDGKLPIHLRLGFANDIDMFAETVSHKKNRKSKSGGGLEQV